MLLNHRSRDTRHWRLPWRDAHVRTMHGGQGGPERVMDIAIMAFLAGLILGGIVVTLLQNK